MSNAIAIEVKALFENLDAKHKFKLEEIAQQIATTLNLTETIDEVLEVCLTIRKYEFNEMIHKQNLKCPVCNTAEFLVYAPVVFDTEREEYTRKFEVYCGKPDPDSSIFSKCWHHVIAYPEGIQHKRRKQC